MVGIVPEAEVVKQVIRQDEVERVFNTVHLRSFYKPFLNQMYELLPKYDSMIGKSVGPLKA